MFIQIEPNTDVPIYTQLTQQIIEGFAIGDIKQGESLPSLATELGVNMHTVNKSYHELEKKGMITILPKSGAIVNASYEMGRVKAQQLEYMERMLRPVIAEGIIYGLEMSDFEELVDKIIKKLQ